MTEEEDEQEDEELDRAEDEEDSGRDRGGPVCRALPASDNQVVSDAALHAA